MRALAKPNPEHNFSVTEEINNLVTYRDAIHQDPKRNRHIPAVGQQNRVLIATWNIANLGVHKRRTPDLEVIASILGWFEIIAVQEVADNLNDFSQLVSFLPKHFKHIFNDRAGNDERAAYIYDSRWVSLGSKIGEVAIVESDRKFVRLDGIQRKFQGFNRNPYLASFVVQDTRLVFANCHLLFGNQDTSANKVESMERRQLEAYAIARWCDLRRKDKHAWSTNIIAIGDFNLPRMDDNDPIFQALTKRGLRLPPHDTRIPTNVSNSADYDQIAVTPGLLSRITDSGVFDFDGAIFSNIYDPTKPGYWRRCAKYYISDHRPLWVQLSI